METDSKSPMTDDNDSGRAQERERSNGEKLESEVLSDTVMKQHQHPTEEREHQQEECNRDRTNGVQNMNQKMMRDINSLPLLPKNPCIFRVRERLRALNHQAYTPEVVSIGPYHHRDPKLVAMEVHKKRYLNFLVEQIDQVISVEACIEAMMELEDRARNYYASPIVLNRDEFVEMMLLDGCFVIVFLYKFYRERNPEIMADDPILDESWMATRILRDLMLVENQLPFFILSKLYDMIHASLGMEFPPLTDLVIKYVMEDTMPFRTYMSQINIGNTFSTGTSENKHLLDLVYKFCIPSARYECLDSNDDICINIPSVTELQEAGVKFRVKEGFGIFDISFEGGEMKIPKIDVGVRVEKIFCNMIAYEQHSPYIGPKYFTNYTYFMNLLINSGKDVNQLCHSNIFEYKLGNDEGVALMFNKLNEERFFKSQGFYLSELCKNVNAHCDQRWNKLMAKLRRDYFYSPWAGVSTVAAAFLILLTLTQTVAAIIALPG